MLFVNISQLPIILFMIITLIGLIALTLFRKSSLRRAFFSLEQLSLIKRQKIKGVTTSKIICLVVITIMLGIALLDPRGSSLSSDLKLEGMDIVFVYDISRSMDAEDIQPSRLTLAKSLGEQLVNSLAGNRIGLVAFAADAIRLLPLTTDSGAVELFLRELSTDMIGSQSTDIGKALEEALKNFKEDTLTHKAIILLSDGENLDGDINNALDQIKKQGISLFILGIGTEAGGTVLNINGSKTNVLKNLIGQEIISKLDQKYLKQLASDSGGEYLLGSRISAQKLIGLIDNIEKSPFGTNTQSYLEPKFRTFILLALLALVIYLFLPEKKYRALILLIGIFIQNPHHALTAERNAYSSYEKEEYSTALRYYQRSLVKNPKNIKSKFGEGSTLYKLERSDRSEKSFLALTNSENPKIAQQSLYNAANAKLQGKDTEGAIELYKKVMQNNPVDSKIYEKALNNYIYARAVQQQNQQKSEQNQQDQNEQQEQQQGQENQDSQDQQQGQQNAEQESSQDEQNGQGNPQNQEEQNAPSQSISPSDIDNLLGIAGKSEKENFSKQHKGKKGALQQNKY